MNIKTRLAGVITAIVCAVNITAVMPLNVGAQTGTYGVLSYEAADGNGDGVVDHIVITDCNESATEVDIPKEIDGLPVTTLGRDSFYNCDQLTEFIIPDSITTLERRAITCCDKLEYVYIPATTIEIGVESFSTCNFKKFEVNELNPNYCSLDGALFNKSMTNLIVYPSKIKETEYIVPETVTEIGSYAFVAAYSLEKIVLPKGLKTINNSAFYYCMNLTDINIPESVTVIPERAFEDCHSLKNISLPNSITEIDNSAFKTCTSLENIIIPNNVRKIGTHAFENCSLIENVILPSSVELLCISAFANCENLKSVTINNPNCGFIGAYTIYNTKDENDNYIFNGTIYGYKNSEAESSCVNYNLNFVSIGEYEIIKGDVNYDSVVNLYDAIDIARYIMKIKAFSDEQMDIADYNSDNAVNLYDVIEIARFIMS